MLSPKRGVAALVPEGIIIGHESDFIAATGCSVVLCPQGAVGSVSVRGGAPATRETDLLAPENTVKGVHGVVLSGGSAFGLDAASGVMRYLEEEQIGVSFAGAVVPIVVGASLFDLDCGSASIHPSAKMGYAAASQARDSIQKTGNIGAGTGASVGRFLGLAHAMKGGLGVASVQSKELLVTALIAVNSLGNIYDQRNACYLAGAWVEHEGRRGIVEPLEILPKILLEQEMLAPSHTNTTIGVVLTNANIDKSEAYRVACAAHNGLARSIYPVHTSFDGDALFALATGSVDTHPDLVGALAALAVENAVLDAVCSAEEAYGLVSARSFKGK